MNKDSSSRIDAERLLLNAASQKFGEQVPSVADVHIVSDSFTYLWRTDLLRDRRSHFVASSTLGRKLDEIPAFFEAFLTFASKLSSREDVILTGGGTTCDKMVRRIGELFRVPVVPLVSHDSNCESWPTECVLYLDRKNRGIDHALACIADQVTAMSVRGNGRLHQALLRRLERRRSLRVLVEPTLTNAKLTQELMARGASGWIMLGGGDQGSEAVQPATNCISPSSIDSRQYLLHWTRRRSGPWPDQSETDFLDRLIFQDAGKDHCAVASLRRILASRRILATNELTRDSRSVVCFSDLTFGELLASRVFRAHLNRWDFEPLGIAIKKSWLIKQGVRPVIYGDENCWNGLSDHEKPFFQLNRDGGVDWSQEKEWRVVGDVDLRAIGRDDAVVFVRTAADAAEISAFSHWPIVVLSQ